MFNIINKNIFFFFKLKKYFILLKFKKYKINNEYILSYKILNNKKKKKIIVKI